jgi:CDP-6-deoxy-D-xylo-4-hexulose-3-dehydrase
MRTYYAEANYGEEEIAAVIEVLKNSRLALMAGKHTIDLERSVAKLFGKSHGVMTNSGSSANLLALKSLELPVGSKVITPALTFSTTVSPIVHAGLIPVFVDVDPDTLQLDPRKLDELDLTGVSAILVPNLIGNLADWPSIGKFAAQAGIKTIEDSADTIGYTLDGKIVSNADVTTTSFYASHVVTGAGFGGMVAFDDDNYAMRARSFRSWGRRSSQYGETEDYDRRFSAVVDGIPYDDKYIFDDLGYNLIPSEISAAFAKVQLGSLELNLKKRKYNFSYLKKGLRNICGLKTFTSYPGVDTGWLAFPLLLQENLAGKRRDLQIYLEKADIQTRTIFTGNITRQPVAEKFTWIAGSEFQQSDLVMENGILLGCHDRMTNQQLDYIVEKISAFAENA